MSSAYLQAEYTCRQCNKNLYSCKWMLAQLTICALDSPLEDCEYSVNFLCRYRHGKHLSGDLWSWHEICAPVGLGSLVAHLFHDCHAPPAGRCSICARTRLGCNAPNRIGDSPVQS